MQPAAFFDLDRTLIKRSSVLALAGSFRRRGLISRLDLVKSAFWQILFVLRGASAERVRRAAEDGMKILNGFSVADMQHLVGDAMETVLRPLVYEEPLHLLANEDFEFDYRVRRHGRKLLFDPELKIGWQCRQSVPALFHQYRRYGRGKADALRELAAAEGFDLGESTAYSDSYSDVPFLEAVGHPVAANPDRKLRRIAAERGWPVVHFAP